MQQVHIVKIIDGANFGHVIKQRAFTDPRAGETWGATMRDALRNVRRAEGEDDEAFILAIDYEIRPIDFAG